MNKFVLGMILVLLSFTPFVAGAAGNGKNATVSNLSISQDSVTGQIVVSWDGKGVLKKATNANGKFRPVAKRGNQSRYIVQLEDGDSSVFRLDSAEGSV